jgi:hypothetical protein
LALVEQSPAMLAGTAVVRGLGYARLASRLVNDRRDEDRSDRHRPLVRRDRAQAADRRRHAVPAAALEALAVSGGSVAIATGTAMLLSLGTTLVFPT